MPLTDGTPNEPDDDEPDPAKSCSTFRASGYPPTSTRGAAGALELEIHSFARDGVEATQYGRRWVSIFLRGPERMTVAIKRTV
jgi:hypothetical protein